MQIQPDLAAALATLGELVIEPHRIVYDEEPIVLGFGISGRVQRAYLLDEDASPVKASRLTPLQRESLVAVKTLRSESYNQTVLKRLIQEIRAWKDLHHRFILPFTGFYVSGDLHRACLISPYKSRGNLPSLIIREDPTPLERLWFALQTLNGLTFMHNLDLRVQPNDPKGVVHGDLRGNNVMVDDNDDILLSEVGLGRILLDPGIPNAEEWARGDSDLRRWSTLWNSPELLRTQGSLKTTMSDIWAWACVVVEIVKDWYPYQGPEGEDVLAVWQERLPIRGDAVPTSRSSLLLPFDLWSVVGPCWNFDAADRPTAEQCFVPFISLFAAMVKSTLQAPILKSAAISRPRKTKARTIFDRLSDPTTPVTVGELASILDDVARLTKSTQDDKTTKTLYAVRDDIKLNHSHQLSEAIHIKGIDVASDAVSQKIVPWHERLEELSRYEISPDAANHVEDPIRETNVDVYIVRSREGMLMG